MSGKKKSPGTTITLAPRGGIAEDDRSVKAFELRIAGTDYDSMAEELGVTAWEARELASFGFARLATETAEEIRATVEARLDDILRRLYSDLKIATSQPIRNSIYALILKTEAQRSKLLGLDIPSGVDDA